MYFASVDAAQAHILQVWSNQGGKNNNCGILPLYVM